MRRLTIDCAAERVTLRTNGTERVFGRKWVVFYLALALRRAHGRHALLTSSQLQHYGKWLEVKAKSVGKMVSTHLRELAKSGLTDVLVHEGKTKGWRLDLSPTEITFLPNEEACRLWLDDQLDQLDGMALVPEVITEWLTKTVRALIRLQQGEIDEGARFCVEARGGTASTLLKAIAELVEIRLKARQADYPEEWPQLQSVQGRIGDALRARAELFQALKPDMDNLDLLLESHRRRVIRLEELPDINAIGIAHNVGGVLSRRSGRLEQAARRLRYAIALLAASFDLPTLQAAIFNLGHTLYKSAERREVLETSHSILSLARELLETLGLGRDFAQGEVVLGLVCLKLGRSDEAEHWLREAAAIVTTLRNDYDQAEVELLRTRIKWVRSWEGANKVYEDPEILAAYDRARDLLMSVGFDGADVVEEKRLYRKGVRPLWLPDPSSRP